MSRRWATTLLAATALALGVGGPAAAQQPQTDASLPDIEDEVMCPICGTALNLSESPQAERERVFIRRMINEGASKEEIKDALVVEYGSEVLAIPGTSGFDLAAWVVPGVAILLAGGGLWVGIRRWRAGGDGGEGQPPGPASTDPADEERLDADLGRYQL
jgi:cytochrome c-type biogenesis protein CcmH